MKFLKRRVKIVASSRWRFASRKGVTADQQIYSRLHSDIGAIRNLAPNLSGVQYHSADDGKGLIVKLKPLARVLLSFKGMYDMPKVAHLYGMLSGVERAEPNLLVSTDMTWTLCATQVESTWHYVFYQKVGTGRLHHFASDRGGQVASLGVWDLPASSAEAESTQPTWVAQYWNQKACGE